MSEEFGSDYIFITDEEGKEYELEVLDTLMCNDQTYFALVSANTDEENEDEDEELIILKTIYEDGEELLSTLDDEKELDTVYELFMDRLFAEEE